MIANLSQKFNTRVTIVFLSAFILIGEVYWYDLPVISSIAFLAYTIVLGKTIGERITEYKDLQWWTGIATLFCLISLTGVLAYYPYKITPEISLISIFAPAVFLFKKKKKTIEIKTEPAEKQKNILLYLFFALEALLIGTIIYARNGELMQSPWLAFASWFFILFAVSTALFVYLLAKKTTPSAMLMGVILHFFVFYSIAAIVYKLGFGFDGFIHRATESWILQSGFINPKEPFYIGQYGLIVTLSRITGISINALDIFFIPLLASISIPTLIYSVLPRAWNITKQIALALALCVPFIFFLSFNLTTPHNMVLLLTLLTVIALIGYSHKILPFSLVCTLALTALATHPLLGVPLMLIVISAHALSQCKSQKTKITLATCLLLILSVIPLAMFGIQQWLAGYGLPKLINPFIHLNLFLEFFTRPFWYKAHAPWYLEVLYIWQYALTPVVIIFSLVGAWFLRKQKFLPQLLVSSSSGFLIGAFLLRTLVTFPNVASQEQGNYPLRLLVGAIVLLIPLLMYGIYKCTESYAIFIARKLQTTNTTLFILGSIKIGILLMLSLYFSYPQYNSKVYFPGFNVTDYDKKVVEYIHNQNTSYDYVVLSTILTSVTALTEYPFAHYVDTALGSQFYYSIPAGGPLYILYEEMLYQGQKKETIDKVFDLTHADKVYFVVPWYWKNSSSIVENAKKTAKSWQSFDDKMWVFEYTKTGS